jgi:intracellular sulfur oxidation DsrE/DsrF family protein
MDVLPYWKNNAMRTFPLLICLFVSANLLAQQRVNPVIKKAGGVFEVADAVEKPDATLPYKIVIELFSASEDPKEVNQGLNNVARLINLHVSGGVPASNLEVVVAIHGEATYTITDSKTYEKRYQCPNPNLELFKELAGAGVKLLVCGQSLVARSVPRSTIIPEIKIATSMLTTVTTHQLKGFAYLKF